MKEEWRLNYSTSKSGSDSLVFATLLLLLLLLSPWLATLLLRLRPMMLSLALLLSSISTSSGTATHSVIIVLITSPSPNPLIATVRLAHAGAFWPPAGGGALVVLGEGGVMPARREGTRGEIALGVPGGRGVNGTNGERAGWMVSWWVCVGVEGGWPRA
jgi:hypothetical protein